MRVYTPPMTKTRMRTIQLLTPKEDYERQINILRIL